MKTTTVFLLLLIQLFTVSSFAQTYYVSASSGNDTRTAVQAQNSATPWKTIQHACDNASAGSIINIMAGTYQEEVGMNKSGSAAGGYITIQNNGSDVVLLDGNATARTLFTITNKSYIRIQGINFTNCVGNNSIGLLVDGTSNHIEILNNKFYGISWTATVGAIPTASKNAQPLIVYGTNGTTAITNLLIQGNELYNNRPGFSEVLAVNGNVDGFSVLNNIVHDNENIGIDIIGHEGTSPNASTDQARNGEIKGNKVYKCSSVYDGSAAGIYVDGGKNLTIENNICYRNDWGIEIGCENQGTTTSDIVVRNNLIYRNTKSGMQLGGYDGPTNTGTVLNTVVSNNTFFSNDTSNGGNGEIALTYSSGCSFINNIFYATNKRILSDQWGGGPSPGLTFNYNLYYSFTGTAANIIFGFNNNSYTGLANFKSGAGQDANSSFQNPQLVSNATSNPDLHITSGSPAKDAGKPSFVAGSGELDMDGQSRIENSHVDIGADEYPITLGIFNNIFTSSHDSNEKERSGWVIYPNPTKGNFKIDNLHDGESIQKIYLYTPEWQYEELTPIGKSEYFIPEKYSQGVYSVIIETDNHRIVKQLVKF